MPGTCFTFVPCRTRHTHHCLRAHKENPRIFVSFSVVVVVSLPDVFLSFTVTLAGIDACPKLSVLFVSQNRVETLSGLRKCGELWWLDASRNALRSVSALAQLPVMGHLDLSHTGATLRMLSALRTLPILHLKVLHGNPELGAPTDRRARLAVVALLPQVWVLDGQLVTCDERQLAAQFATGPDAPPALAGCLTGARRKTTPRPSSAVSTADGGDADAVAAAVAAPPPDSRWASSILSQSALVQSFMELMAAHPERPSRVDAYRLRAYAVYYTMDALRINKYSSMHPPDHGLPALRLPLTHVQYLARLAPPTQLDVVAVLTAMSLYDVPHGIVQDALLIMLADALPPGFVNDLASLPHVCACAAVHLLHTLVTQSNTVASREAQATVAQIAEGVVHHTRERTGEHGVSKDQLLEALPPLLQQVWQALPPGGILPPFTLPSAGQAATAVAPLRVPSAPHRQRRGSAGAREGADAGAGGAAADAADAADDADDARGIDHRRDMDAAERQRRDDVAVTMAAVDVLLLENGDASVEVESVSAPSAVVARHAALLLARSPSFPPLVAPVSPRGPRAPTRKGAATHARVAPLLAAAKLDRTWAAGQIRAQSRPSSRGGERHRREPAPRLMLGQRASGDLATLSTSTVVAASLLFQISPSPPPSPGGSSELALPTSPTARSLTFHNDGVLVASSIGTASVRHHAALPGALPPRAVMLHRTADAVSGHGVPHSMGVVNLPVSVHVVDEVRRERLQRAPVLPAGPRGEAPLAMAPVHGFTLNGTWDPKFVVAADDIVTAQNHVAHQLGALEAPTGQAGGWAQLDNTPYMAAPSGSGVAPLLPVLLEQPVAEQAYQVDGLFNTPADAVAPVHTRVHALTDAILDRTSTMLKDDARAAGRAGNALALVPAPDDRHRDDWPLRRRPAAHRRPPKRTAATGSAAATFLTGVDTGDDDRGDDENDDEGEMQGGGGDDHPPVSAQQPLRTTASGGYVAAPSTAPALGLRGVQHPSFTQSEMEEQQLMDGTTADRRAGDRDWFAVPARARLVVCPDTVPWLGTTRTRPARGDMDKHLRPARRNKKAAAALVPTSHRAASRAGSSMRPPQPQSAATSTSRVTRAQSSRREGFSGGFRVVDSQVHSSRRLSASKSPSPSPSPSPSSSPIQAASPSTAPEDGDRRTGALPSRPQSASGSRTPTMRAPAGMGLQPDPGSPEGAGVGAGVSVVSRQSLASVGPSRDDPGSDGESVDVDDDGYYTVTVPGAGKAFASVDGPAPNVDVLATFAAFMKGKSKGVGESRGSRARPPPRLQRRHGHTSSRASSRASTPSSPVSFHRDPLLASGGRRASKGKPLLSDAGRLAVAPTPWG